ncbi:MAG: hypothetical protein R6V52_08920 [Bacteroidales bacterium]
MKKLIYTLLILGLQVNVFAQKSIIIENKEHAGYEKIRGTALSIVPPESYEKSDRFHGFENQLAGSSIMVFKAPGSVQENFLAFKRNKDIREGMVVADEIMYRINGFQAMLQSGVQIAYGKTYMRYVLVIGDAETSYVMNASWIKDKHAQKEAERIKSALLSVIYKPENKTDITDAFDFGVDHSFCNMQPGNILMNSLVFTDDGQMPSQTDAKTAFMINETTVPRGEDKEKYLDKVLNQYPLEFGEKQNISPKAVSVDDLSGYEIYGIGKNTKTGKSELIYVMVLFDKTTVYQLTGTTLKYFEEHLACFKKTARTFSRKQEPN